MIQIDIAPPADRMCRAFLRYIWTRALVGFFRTAKPGDYIVFCPELLPAFAGSRRRIAYERLLLDLIEGDPTLFVRSDEVEAQ